MYETIHFVRHGAAVRMVRKNGVNEQTVPIDQIKRAQKLEHGSVAGKIVLWTAVGVLALFGIAVATCAAA